MQAFDKRLPDLPGIAAHTTTVIVFLLQSRVEMEQAKAGPWEASLANAISAAEAGSSSHRGQGTAPHSRQAAADCAGTDAAAVGS